MITCILKYRFERNGSLDRKKERKEGSLVQLQKKWRKKEERRKKKRNCNDKHIYSKWTKYNKRLPYKKTSTGRIISGKLYLLTKDEGEQVDENISVAIVKKA